MILKRSVIVLCLPPYIGWVGVVFARSWPSWDNNPWSSWPIFVLLMIGWISIWSVLCATVLCAVSLARRNLSNRERGTLIAVLLTSSAATWMFYGILADH